MRCTVLFVGVAILVLGGAVFAESLHDAVASGDLAEVKRLINKGADVNAEDSMGLTPLHMAAGMGRKGAVELLISKGADVNAIMKKGNTALSLSARYGNSEIEGILKKAGAKE